MNQTFNYASQPTIMQEYDLENTYKSFKQRSIENGMIVNEDDKDFSNRVSPRQHKIMPQTEKKVSIKQNDLRENFLTTK